MRQRVVKINDLDRVLKYLSERGIEPVAFTLLPTGAICLHKSFPSDQTLSEAEREAKAWDEALAA